MIYVILFALDLLSGGLAFLCVWSTIRVISAIRHRSWLRTANSNGVPRFYVTALIFGTCTYFVGHVALVSGPFWAASIMSIYPGCFIFYIIPTHFTDRLPEASLYFIGSACAVMFWASILWITGLLASRLARGARNALAAA